MRYITIKYEKITMKLVSTYYIIQTNIIQGASYMKNYKKTKLACYLGFITQAIAAAPDNS